MQKNINFESYLSNIETINPSFDKAILKIAYHGKNRNNSNITKLAFENAITSLYNVPVVVNYKVDKDDFGGHDGHIEKVANKDGTTDLYYINDTSPIGVVPTGANTWWEDINNKEYFCTNVILWARQREYVKIKSMGTINHSMEIMVDEDEWVDNVQVINKFHFTALCLLSDTIEPCFEDSKMQLYTLDQNKFKTEFHLMLDELKSYTNNIQWLDDEWKTSQFDYEENKTKEEGGWQVNIEKLSMACGGAKYSKDEQDVNKFEFLFADEKFAYVFDNETFGCGKIPYALNEETEEYELDFACGTAGKFSMKFADKVANEENPEEYSLVEVEIEIVAEGIARLMGISEDPMDTYKRMKEEDTELATMKADYELKIEELNKNFNSTSDELNAKVVELAEISENFSKVTEENNIFKVEAKDAKIKKALDEVVDMFSKEDIDTWTKKAVEYEDANTFVTDIKLFAFETIKNNPRMIEETRMGLITKEKLEDVKSTNVFEKLENKKKK